MADTKRVVVQQMHVGGNERSDRAELAIQMGAGDLERKKEKKRWTREIDVGVTGWV
jgi:hypothetical protein